MGGLRYAPVRPFEFFAMGSAGLGSEPGTPRFRVLAGLALLLFDKPPPPPPEDIVYELVQGLPRAPAEPQLEPEPTPPEPPTPEPSVEPTWSDTDPDGDGVVDALDACIHEKGTREYGGCPETGDPLVTLEVSSVGLGVQNMSRTYQTTVPSRPEMLNIIRTAYDRGVTFFDAAEAYGPHEVERILGEGIASFRDKVVLASKFGWNIDLETGERRPGLNSRPEHIKLAVEGMLKRLRTDRIDLLYQHRVDPEVPIEDVAGAVKELMAQGKVLHWGLSEMGPKTLRRAHAALPVSAVQNEYSMLWRGPEAVIIPLCQELGIGFVPWSPLGVGFLTGAIDANTRFAPGDIRGVESRFAPENLPHNLALVESAKRWAERKRATPAQIALAWLMAQTGVSRGVLILRHPLI
ncbi:aldo/keto reductase [Corallococcus exiguus]|uniref:aldo/keto reductase n=1 Tax=Corallococcus exiguus TaxID=83462 RepID=UPI0021537817|nr:aldo/keto reductase [Corallococcus exiguus]